MAIGLSPLRDRLANLEQENRNLQAQLGNTPSEASASAQNQPLSSHQPGLQETGSLPVPLTVCPRRESVADDRPVASPIASRIATIPGSQSSYYGRTSALFDEEPADRTAPRGGVQTSEFTRRQFMGEAAHQRQLETLNYRTGKLDFDGVDPELGMHL
ncbi:hypothetical protein V498_07794, partial [Pseudogymnoascus sp. VKM F-4517 (FW-2822)]